jgi:hypothetical protein
MAQLLNIEITRPGDFATAWDVPVSLVGIPARRLASEKLRFDSPGNCAWRGAPGGVADQPAAWETQRLPRAKPAARQRRAGPAWAALACGLLLAWPGLAQVTNGDFEDPTTAPWQWSAPQPVQPAGALPPRRVAGAGGNRVGRVGSSGQRPGIEGAALWQAFDCGDTWGSICTVVFTANFNQRGKETARVYLDNGARAAVGTIPNGRGTYKFAIGGCRNPTRVAFWVESAPGDPVGIQSTLDLDDVSSECWGLIPPIWSTPIEPEPEPIREFRPGTVPNAPATQETVPVMALSLELGAGASAIGYPFMYGENTLDEILPAADGTLLAKRDGPGGGLLMYQRSGGRWYPDGGTLWPGEGAFVLNPMPIQAFPIDGTEVLPLSREHPDGGEEFLGNPLPRTAGFEELTGCAPRLGDAVVRYQTGGVAFPPAVATVHTFNGTAWMPALAVRVGEAVLVQFGRTVVIEPPPSIVLRPDEAARTLVATGPVPAGTLVQAATDLSGPWTTLMGVGLPYTFWSAQPYGFFRLATGCAPGGIQGQVLDGQGQPCAGVRLQLAPYGPVTHSGLDGRFVFEAVPAGLVDVRADRTVQAVTVEGVTGPLTVFDTYSVAVVAGGQAPLLCQEAHCQGTVGIEWGKWHTDQDGTEWREGEKWFRCTDTPKHADRKLGTVREEKKKVLDGKGKPTGDTVTTTTERNADGKVTKVTETTAGKDGKAKKTKTTEWGYDDSGNPNTAKQTTVESGKTTTTEWVKESNGKWYRKDGDKLIEDPSAPQPPK